MKRSIRIPLVIASLMVGPLFANVALADPPHAPPQQQPQHPHAQHAHGGLLDEALHGVTLRTDQRQAVEALKTAMTPTRDAAKAARKDLLEALAKQVEQATIDRPALQPKVDAVVNAAVNERTAERAAADRLHAILDRAQRTQLANALEARMEHHRGHAPPAGAAPTAPDARHAGGHHEHGELAHLAKELNLTPAQRQQIAAVLHDPAQHQQGRQSAHAAKEAHKKMLEAFKADAFAIDQVVPNDARAKSTEHVGRFITVVQKVVPILSPAQRAVAATKLRERAVHGAMKL